MVFDGTVNDGGTYSFTVAVTAQGTGSKAFTMVVDPDPSFQGMLWYGPFSEFLTGSGTEVFIGNNDKFYLDGNCGANGGVITNFVGGNGSGVAMTVPSSPLTRHCVVHVDTLIAIAPSFDLTTLLTLGIDAATPSYNISGVGPHDIAFTLSPNTTHQFYIYLRQQIQGINTRLVWRGYVYTAFYT